MFSDFNNKIQSHSIFTKITKKTFPSGTLKQKLVTFMDCSMILTDVLDRMILWLLVKQEYMHIIFLKVTKECDIFQA